MVESIGVGVESVGISLSLGLSYALVQHTESRCVGWVSVGWKDSLSGVTSGVGWVGVSRVGVSSIGSSVWEPVSIVVVESWISLSLSIWLSICITLHKTMIKGVWVGSWVVVGQWSSVGDSLGWHNRLDNNGR